MKKFIWVFAVVTAFQVSSSFADPPAPAPVASSPVGESSVPLDCRAGTDQNAPRPGQGSGSSAAPAGGAGTATPAH